MHQIWVATCLAASLLVGQATAAERAQKAEAAENKAEVLEENAAGSKAPTSIRDHYEARSAGGFLRRPDRMVVQWPFG